MGVAAAGRDRRGAGGAGALADYALVPLLLVPVAIIALVAWTFGAHAARRVPLITRIVAGARWHAARRNWRRTCALYAQPHRLLGGAAVGALALVNLLLALLAVPDGLLASLGITPP